MVLYDISSFAGVPLWLLTIALLWSLIWKGIALWKSARKNSPIWFIILLVVNTLGILEILYIYLFSEIKFTPERSKKTRKKKRKQAVFLK